MNYHLANLAMNNSSDIAQYTFETWGSDAVENYLTTRLINLMQ